MTEIARNDQTESPTIEGDAATAQPALRIGVGALMGRLSANKADKAA